MIGEPLSLGLVGFGFSLLLVWASRRFAVEIDEKLEEVAGMLPGSNCGACGFKGCRDYAQALVSNPSLIDRCRVITHQERARIASYLGVKVGKVEWAAAIAACAGGSKERYQYKGERSCLAASILQGGPTSCPYACLGFGDCEKSCPFGAIEMVNGLPHIDWEKCTGCGICVQKCPRGVLTIVPRNTRVFVQCHSPQPGRVVVASCTKGCIKCKLCEKNCPTGAIKFVGDKISIDPTLCNGCGKCVEVCPRKVIVWAPSSAVQSGAEKLPAPRVN
jgi:Na+-translocating ferredoxin:NAD+ oxidoreductase RNF subunit RnfB